MHPSDYQRSIAGTLLDRLHEPRRFMQVITGPRQVGKTTVAQQVLQSWQGASHYATADVTAPPEPLWIEHQWQLARLQTQTARPVLLVLDEAQKITRWSETVKRCWDEDTRAGRDIRVVILGSSALLMQAGLTESLAGRFEQLHASHWSWSECQAAFGWNLDQYLYFGGYPGAATLIGDEQRWAQYVRESLIETTLSKDILLLTRIEKPALLRQLFVMAAEYSGQIVSYQKLLGQLLDAGNTTTLAHYQHLLEGAGLIKGLQKWHGTPLRRRASSPKWLVLNNALMTATAGVGFAAWRQDVTNWGRLVETAVGAHLVNSALGTGVDIYYWRNHKNEVDFVLRQADRLLGIEVKSGQRRHFEGMTAFQHAFAPAKALLVGPDGIALEEFLRQPARYWLENMKP
ncbi:ATP-binding protein [candidate division KSB1 bacterium]|nr:ATP-binding protein [candidate division KSB1 bacterium]